MKSNTYYMYSPLGGQGLAETKLSLSRLSGRYDVIYMSPRFLYLLLGKQRRELAHEIILTQFDKHSNLK